MALESTTDDEWVVRTLSQSWNRDDRPWPWRHSRDPWEILVSEFMSQQTQLSRVVPSWTRFVNEFPDPPSAAAAPVARVVELWKGLGYNRRAVHLHACATAITAEHDGRVPAVLEDLLTLPGIGPYTARAVLVFAFERDVAVLDTNVGRVLARLDGRTYSSRDAQARADDLVPSGSAWRWNQSLLDFGSTTCTKRAPHCDRCVIRSACAWQGVGRDPADGSAGVPAPQSTFAGSDRQGRGRLIDELRDGPVREADLAEAMGWPGDEARARRVADRVVADGLAVVVGDRFVLPGRR